MGEFEVPIDRSQVLLFARAIGDPNPRFRDGSVVPPTYPMVADAFDPEFDRRPSEDSALHEETSSNPEALLHVSQSFRYLRPVRVGDVLMARRLPRKTWTKQGRKGGTLEFIEATTEFRDGNGEIVAEAIWLDVRPEHGHREMSVDAPAAEAVTVDEAVPGHRITRTRIVMYVGAVGDFHPLHHDEAYAKANGYPSVFAPGMLTMAIAGRAVTDFAGDRTVMAFSGRLTGQVWPDDVLRTSLDGDGDAPNVRTVNQHGHIVFDGHAVFGRTMP
jgi:acyl dehydratase